MTKKIPLSVRPLSYFEHMERKTNLHTAQWDVVEWPEPIEVKEHRSSKDHWDFRKAWSNRLRKESK